MWNGRTALAARPHLAAALAERPDYAAYARDRATDEARRELDDRALRLARSSRGLTPERVRQALAESPEGRAIQARVDTPGPRDLERHLAAWLGDVHAADAFRAWELDAVARVLAGEADGEPTFADLYAAAYRLFFAPSYARILTPLVVGRDPASGAVGLWRIVLPRTVWIGWRKRGFEDVEYQRIPMDLVPERPLGLWLAERLVSAHVDLPDRLRAAGLGPANLAYESLVKPRHRDPGRAFARSRVTLRLADARDGELVLIADLDLDGPAGAPALRAIQVRSMGDSSRTELASTIEQALGR